MSDREEYDYLAPANAADRPAVPAPSTDPAYEAVGRALIEAIEAHIAHLDAMPAKTISPRRAADDMHERLLAVGGRAMSILARREARA